MTPEQIEAVRKEFEAVARQHGMDPWRTDPDGPYRYECVKSAWQIFLAARRSCPVEAAMRDERWNDSDWVIDSTTDGQGEPVEFFVWDRHEKRTVASSTSLLSAVNAALESRGEG